MILTSCFVRDFTGNKLTGKLEDMWIDPKTNRPFVRISNEINTWIVPINDVNSKISVNRDDAKRICE